LFLGHELYFQLRGIEWFRFPYVGHESYTNDNYRFKRYRTLLTLSHCIDNILVPESAINFLNDGRKELGWETEISWDAMSLATKGQKEKEEEARK
jgi:hypothetical protein